MHLMYGRNTYSHCEKNIFRVVRSAFYSLSVLAAAWSSHSCHPVSFALCSSLFHFLPHFSFNFYSFYLILTWGSLFCACVCVVHTVYVRVLFSFIRFIWPNNIVWNLNSTFVLLHLPLLLTRRGKKR